MALSTKTLKNLRSDLRSRLANISDEKFFDSELNSWLNLGQYEVARGLSAISDHWYGTTEATVDISDCSAGSVTAKTLGSDFTVAESGILKFTQVIIDAGAATNKLCPFKRLEEIYGMASNSNYDNSFAVAWHGAKLYFFFGTSLTMDATTCTLFYLRKPTEMASDASTVDVPTEYVDLVVTFAQSKAYQKLGMMNEKSMLDADIAGKFNDIRQLFNQEIQIAKVETQPGQQSKTGLK